MRLGSYIHQLAVSLPWAPYREMCRSVDPSFPQANADDLGYLIIVATGEREECPTWSCLHAGSARQVLHAWRTDGAAGTGMAAGKLDRWFDQLLGTAVPVSSIALDKLARARIHLRWDGSALEKARHDPVTAALAAEGAFSAEHQLLQLEVHSHQALARRLGWLLATSAGAVRPAFDLVAGVAEAQLCDYLVRLHRQRLWREAR